MQSASRTLHFGLPLDAPADALSRAEFVTAISHMYRAEMQRSTQWRVRLDTTTNWAIIATTGVVTYGFSQVEHSHASLLVGMLMVLTFLMIEARRYRILAVWLARTRILERNFLAPILRGETADASPQWSQRLAADLLQPEYTMTRLHAIRARLSSNYVSLFGLLIFCWLVKVRGATDGKTPSLENWIAGMRVGLIPGSVVGAFVAIVCGGLLLVAITGGRRSREEDLFHDAGCPEG